jgi:hypothetical protein
MKVFGLSPVETETLPSLDAGFRLPAGMTGFGTVVYNGESSAWKPEQQYISPYSQC